MNERTAATQLIQRMRDGEVVPVARIASLHARAQRDRKISDQHEYPRDGVPLRSVPELVAILGGTEEDATFLLGFERQRGATTYEQDLTFRSRCAELGARLASDLDWVGHEEVLEQLLVILADYARDAEPTQEWSADKDVASCVMGFASWSWLSEGFSFWSGVYALACALPRAQELSDELVEQLAGGA